MAKRRWIMIKGELVEVTTDYTPPPSTDAKNYVAGDRHYDGLRSPRSDQEDISSRTKHREYMKRHGLTTADDYKETWAKAAQERQKSMAGADPSRVKDISRAIEMVQQGYHPRRYEDN